MIDSLKEVIKGSNYSQKAVSLGIHCFHLYLHSGIHYVPGRK